MSHDVKLSTNEAPRAIRKKTVNPITIGAIKRKPQSASLRPCRLPLNRRADAAFLPTAPQRSSVSALYSTLFAASAARVQISSAGMLPPHPSITTS